MGFLDKLKNWLAGGRKEKESGPVPETPQPAIKTTVYEEEDLNVPPKIDEYVEIEFTKAKLSANQIPTEGTKMVKKKKAAKKATKRKAGKKTAKKAGKKKAARKKGKKK